MGVPNLHLNIIQKTHIVLPELSEQQMFTEYIKEMQSKFVTSFHPFLLFLLFWTILSSFFVRLEIAQFPNHTKI